MRGRRALAGCLGGILFLAGGGIAWSQNDWQFPDPYFGAIEFDVSRPRSAPPRRVDSGPAPPRVRQVRPRTTGRFRPRWSASGARP